MTKKKKAIFAGSFDPITLGHLDIIERAAKLFDEVVVAIGVNTKKASLISLAEREKLIRAVCKKIKHVSVTHFSGLLVDFARAQDAHFLVRGLRDNADLGFELQMVFTNRILADDIESVWVPPSQELTHISSSLVREIIALGGDASAFVPPQVHAFLQKKSVK